MVAAIAVIQTDDARVSQTAPTRLHGRRVCPREDAAETLRWCVADREVLPRRRNDDRTPRRRRYAGLHDVAEVGVYAPIPVWVSRSHWIDYVVPKAAALHPEVLQRHKVGLKTLLKVAVAKSGYAHKRTGRRCIATPETVAQVAGVSERQAQRVNACLRELGVEVVVREGRRLTLEERLEKCWKTRSKQRGLATEVALTIPPELRRAAMPVADAGAVFPARVTPLDLSGQVFLKLELLAPNHLGASRARTKAAAPRRLTHKQRRWASALHLAHQTVDSVPWLAGERPRRIAPALMRFSECSMPWTGRLVGQAIQARGLRLGMRDIMADRVRTRPAVVLAAILGRMDPVDDHPGMGLGFRGDAPTWCGRCDHGWRTSSDADGHVWARKCPDCPDAVRANVAHSPAAGDEPRDGGRSPGVAPSGRGDDAHSLTADSLTHVGDVLSRLLEGTL